MEASLHQALPRSESSSDTEKPPRTRTWLRPLKRLFSLFIPRKTIKRRQIFRRRKKPNERNNPPELVVPRRQVGDPTNGRLPTADGHRKPDEPKEEDNEPASHPAMETSNDPEGTLTHEHFERNGVDISSLATGGRFYRSVSSGTSTVSPGVYSPASPPPDVISTESTTPLDKIEEIGLPSDDQESRNPSLENRSQEALSSVSTNSDQYYIELVLVVANDNRHKVPALMALDTQASANVMSVALWRKLGMRLESCSQELIPLQSGSGNVVRIETYGRVREVAWHVAGGERTHVCDFLVADLRDHDVILGKRYIHRKKILTWGPDEITVSLKAVVAEDMDVSILTQSGFRALPGIQVQPQETERTFYDSNGVSYAVRDVVQLPIWKKGEAKLTTQDFYVSTDDSSGLRPPCHAILGSQCLVGKVSDEKGVPIAVTQLPSQSASDKAIQEQKKREKEAALAKKEQERRDREKQQAAQRK
ncbi:hypothetical protein BO94DRAFT_554560 [Aspergillus sclerotioniger CBS 115572]|uniref:Uncharacterized protein n=1 Tax=Aspergillus sclerotioniger CBS 115572 TaxID=1450535 RepID=A0A317X332_9EURO|nr:hypothetical protein BO94DRAFT_554560 [Aspergillus sclerotioniger CBS 115572]PWY92963.1 hypothetical protein BO94DRAFT_554560 [Aspergillus sclerotioniger CBS 115572]